MFESLGRRVARRPKTTVLIWALLTVAALALAVLGVGGQNLFERLHTEAPAVPDSPSQRAQDILSASRSTGQSLQLVLDQVPPDTPGLAEAMRPIHIDLIGIPDVFGVVDPFVLPGGPEGAAATPFIARDGDGFLMVVALDPGLSESAESKALNAVQQRLATVPEDLHSIAPQATGRVGGTTLIFDEIIRQVERDLIRGELVALPLALLIMVLVFGGFLAAAMPAAGAVASISAGLGVLYGLSFVMDLDTSVVNVVTVLGLGLSIDYGLLIVSRFREELDQALADDDGAHVRRRRGDGAVATALAATMATAGRTVVFSALTIAIATAGLLVFRPPILRAFGAGGTAVIIIALATALTLVPAMLVLIGRRLARPGVLHRVPGMRRIVAATSDVHHDTGWISRLAAWVQRRPWLVLGGTVALLVLLALPVAHMDLRNTGLRLLPADSPQRTFVEMVAEQFPDAATASIQVVAVTTLAEAEQFATTLAEVDNVRTVEPPTAVGNAVVIGVHADDDDVGGPVERQIVHDIRGLDTAFEVLVAGSAAGQIDFVAAIQQGLPWAIGLVVLATIVLLFLFTGSIVLPVKALLLNVVSITASLGVLTWAFQDGNLAGLLDFTPVGGIETFVVVLVVAFAFGLATDYEVFLLSRIKELHDAGYPNDDAVRIGLQRSGRIITAAAAIIVVVFAGFVTGRLLIIKEVGFALAVAVFIDATLVRLLLVPAAMTLFGRWNWWAPPALRRLHERAGLTG